jgi:hypothetical protein
VRQGKRMNVTRRVVCTATKHDKCYRRSHKVVARPHPRARGFTDNATMWATKAVGQPPAEPLGYFEPLLGKVWPFYLSALAMKCLTGFWIHGQRRKPGLIHFLDEGMTEEGCWSEGLRGRSEGGEREPNKILCKNWPMSQIQNPGQPLC